MSKYITLKNVLTVALIVGLMFAVNWRDKKTAHLNYNKGYVDGFEYGYTCAIDTFLAIAREVERKPLTCKVMLFEVDTVIFCNSNPCKK